jgi:hypothetical protein
MNPRCTNQRIQRYALAFIAAALLLSVFTPFARSDSIGLTWAPNSESDLAGYKLYRGSSSGKYDWVKDVGLSTIIQVDNLTPNQTYYFAVTAYNTQKIESEPSNVVEFTPIPEVIPPEAIGDSISVAEDSSKVITLQATTSTTEAARAGLFYSITSQPSHGVLIGTCPNLTYQPSADFSGTDSFDFQVSDGTSTSLPATISISVTPVNDPPVAVGFAVTAIGGTPVAFALNYLDIDSTSLTSTITRSPLYGTLTTSGTQLVYTANANHSGSDSIEYTVSDGSLTSKPATVLFTVTPRPNTPPVAETQSLVTAEDIQLPIVLKANDRDTDQLTYVISRGPSEGTLIGNPPSLVYSPKPHFHGVDSFEFAALDGKSSSVPVTVSISVTPVNDRPVATGYATTTSAGTPVEVTFQASDIETPLLTFNVTQMPTGGTLVGSGAVRVYTPNSGFAGIDIIRFTASDESEVSVSATITVDVKAAVNTAPSAIAQNLLTTEDTTLPLTLSAMDGQNDPLTYTITSQPRLGRLTGTPPQLQYIPHANTNGVDAFRFMANDGKLNSVAVSVIIQVKPVNDAPTAMNQSLTWFEDRSLRGAVRAVDVEGDTLTYSIQQPPEFGQITGTPPSFVYTPNPNYFGPDGFTFSVSDGIAPAVTGKVDLTIRGMNDAPVANAMTVTLAANSPKAFTVQGSDVDDDPLTYRVSRSPSRGSISGTAPNLTYKPNTGFYGTDTFEFTVSDGVLTSSPALVTVVVRKPVNLAAPQPDVMLVGISGTTTQLIDGTTSVAANDGAVESAEVVIHTAPQHGSVQLAADGTFSYSHSGEANTKDSFSYVTLTDGVASEPIEVSVHVFQLTGLDRDDDQVVVSFPVVAGVTYRVEGSAFFADAATSWEVLAELTSTEETVLEVPTTAVADGTSRYFRVTATDANGTLKTAPYGYQRYALETGAHTYASAFQGMRVLETSVVSAAGNTVVLAASSVVDGHFNAAGAFATHILVVPNTAQWWPILSNTAGQVVLSNDGTDLAESLKAGNSVEIIRMPTASQVVGTAGSPDCALQPGDFVDFVNGNGFLSTLECRSGSDGSMAYYIRSQGSELAPVDASELRFLPGQPVQVQKAVASGTLWFLGRVQSNPLTQYRVGNTETNGSVSQ